MSRFFLIFTAALLFCNCFDADSEKGPEDSTDTVYVFPSASEMNRRLGRGVNLGNALEARANEYWGVTLKADYFKWIADSGFQTVRLPVRWSDHASKRAPYAIDSVFMDTVLWAVNQALDRKLNVVIDMHHYEDLYKDPEAEKPRFLAMWKQIASKFSAFPPEVILEILNEPKDGLDAATWNRYLSMAIDTIRSVEPKRTLVIGTAPWGGLSGLDPLRLPDDSNLIVTVHYYDPHNFTHQGAAFEMGADVYLGTQWRATLAQRSQVDQDIAKIKAWAADRDRPIFMGEFGSYHLADTLSRACYAEYLSTKFSEAGFSWAVWNFSSDFGLMVDSTEAWHGYLTGALLHPGNNAFLDSVLAVKSDVDLNTYVVMEDFEDGIPGLPTSAAAWMDHMDLPADSSYSFWYAFNADTGADTSYLSAPDGTRLKNIIGWETDPEWENNFPAAIGAWGFQGKGLHIKSRLVGKNYPFAGFGAGILGGFDSTFVDLSKLTAIQFRAKGRGHWAMQVISDSVQSDTIENWGNFNVEFLLKPTWEDFVFPVELLLPKRYSRQSTLKWKWEDVRKKIIAIEFMNAQSYDKTPNDSLEIWLDDIRLIGVKESDLGM